MFKKIVCISFLLLNYHVVFAQNDLDALRYSRTGVGGSPRSIAMGGAFGALGADVSCAAYNPAGLALFRKGEVIYSGGLRFTNNAGKFEGKTATTPSGNFIFSNFGLAFAFPSEKDASKRNVFCFSNNQLQNFNSQTQIINGSTTNSIAGDMLTLANQSKSLSQLNPSYELIGYNAYLLDYDSASGKFFSFVDLKRNLSLNRAIATSGRMNEINISLAQSVDDKYYFGASLGIPKIKFESTTTHSESDGKDSMKVGLTSSNTFTSTYIDPLPFVYTDKLGFNSLTYTEYFKTQGYGLNLKLGGIVRVNPNLRLGGYFHTPTVLYLTDTYSYSMKVSFDLDPTKPVEAQYPTNMGKYEYKIVTPMKYGINGAYIFKSLGSIAIDLEQLNYGKANISSTTPTDFVYVNGEIKKKYKNATNIRLGGELNIKPVMIRAGYAIYGSPFGGLYSGLFDRQTISFGIGIRTKSNMFYDIAWAKTFTSEHYYLYSTATPAKADIKLNSTSFLVSIGFKF